MKTIFRKELKDILRWTPVGVIVIGLLCWQQLPSQLHACNGAATSIASMAVIGSSLFAFGLGLLQSLSDLRTDTRTFLLHRPFTPAAIFRGKLAAGFLVHLLAVGIPITVCGIYLESIGPERLPVSWMEMIPAGLCCLASFLFHPAAMWTACRQARWIGTRCLPLCLPLVAITATMLLPDPAVPFWILLLPTGITLVTAWIIIAAARHAFTIQTCLPSPGSEESHSWPNSIGLTAASVLACCTAVIFVQGLLMTREQPTPFTENRLAVSTDGSLWELEESWPSIYHRQQQPPTRTGRQIIPDDAASTPRASLDDTWQELPITPLAAQYTNDLLSTAVGYSSLSSTASTSYGGPVSIYERNGRLYLYQEPQGWCATVTPQGFFRPSETPSGAFSSCVNLWYFQHSRHVLASLGGHRILADSDGIYQLDVDEWTIRKLSDDSADALAIALPRDQVPDAWLWTVSDTRIHRYDLQPLGEETSLPSVDSELIKATHNYPLPQVSLTPAGSWPSAVTGDPETHTFSVTSLSPDSAAIIASTPAGQRTFQTVSDDGTSSGLTPLPDRQLPNGASSPSTWVLPPCMVAGYSVVVAVAAPDSAAAPSVTAREWMMLALHATLGALLAWQLARRRGTSSQAQCCWLIVGMLAGLPAALAVIAVCPVVVRESCSKCRRQRRVDRDQCEFCFAEWETPEDDGIALIGPREQELLSVV